MKIKILFLVVLISTIARSQISTTSALAPTITNAGLGDLYLTSDTKQLYIGLSNGTLSLIGNENDWSLNGNANATATSLLGTTTDTKVALASNNTAILEVGKRGKLGLVTTSLSDANQYMAYLKGNGVSALQFEASAAASDYRPIIFTTAEGNFRIKGAAAANDVFEMGSGGGTIDNGYFDIITGDNGDEPILFKNSNNNVITEMMRIQGQGSGATSTVRVGIMTNGAVANSVLQVGGSFSLPIRTVTASTTLTENDYTLILKPGTYTGTGVTLPYANTCKGRIYILKNISGANISISTYYNRTGVGSAVLTNGRIYSVQSDGTDFHQISDDF
ncbi:hypothetical protein [Flavobacterium sp.]|uniref:hypothetical protein n=1 Tax=Flavobacterium sp. TaxID=239 RepID=UPI0025C3952D|nr:hypothetical protein [Flavobacterium sp.]